MSVLSPLVRWRERHAERRAAYSKISMDRAFELLGLPFKSKSGVTIGRDSALQIATFYSCCKVLSETVGQLPLLVYERVGDNGKRRVRDHPLYKILHDQPNEVMSACTLKKMMTLHCSVSGNAYAYIDRDGNGELIGLLPLQPEMVSQYYDPVTLKSEYEVAINGRQRKFPQADILHIKPLTWDGISGLNPIQYMRETLGASSAMREHGSRLFSNGARPGGIIELAGKMNKDDKASFIADWKRLFGGVENAHGIAITDPGMKFVPTVVSNEDAQFLESMKFSASEICGFMRVPPHMVAQLDRSTNNNIEHQGLEFQTLTMSPHFVMWESEVARQLLWPEERDTIFAEFLSDALTRGDLKSRYDAYNTGRMGGWLSVNDIRAKENMNPLPPEQGDIYIQPLNVKEAGEPEPPAPEPPQLALPKPDENARSIVRGLVVEAMERLLKRERQDIERAFAKKDLQEEATRKVWLETYLTETIEPAKRIVGPSARALLMLDQKRDQTIDVALEQYVSERVRRARAMNGDLFSRTAQSELELLEGIINGKTC